jgi:sugar lactone lactonase YvrE
VVNPEEKRLLGRPRCRWEDNINMDLKEIERGGMDWMDVAQDGNRWRAFVNMVMNLRIQLHEVR